MMSEFGLKINYPMVYTEQIRDLILDKLTVLFNKSTLNAKVRLMLRLPDMFDIKRAQRYREIFDEVSISRFDMANPSFWNMRNIHNFQEYCMSMDSSNKDLNIFIEQGTLVYDFSPPDADVIVASEYTEESLMTQYLSLCELLNTNGYDIEVKDEFQSWDFSCCYINNEIKKMMYFELNDIINKISDFGRYISNVELHILLSMVLDKIKSDIQFTLFNLNLKKGKLDNKMIEHLYTLI